MVTAQLYCAVGCCGQSVDTRSSVAVLLVGVRLQEGEPEREGRWAFQSFSDFHPHLARRSGAVGRV